MLELRGIGKKYKKNIVALDNVNLEFANNGLVFVRGDSGSGKSTLLNIMSTLEYPSEGSVLYNGEVLDKKNSPSYLKNEVSIVFQDSNLFDNLSVIDNLNVYEEKGETEELLKRLDIDSLKNKKVKNLSGGEKRRVAIARAILKHPHILFCDEPEASLDEENRENIFKILVELSKEMLVIVSSHDADVEEYANRIITIKAGKVIEDKKIKKVRENDEKKSSKNYKVNKKFISVVSKDILFSKKISYIVTTLILAVFSSLVLFAGIISKFNYADILTNTMKHEKNNMLLGIGKHNGYSYLVGEKSYIDSTGNEHLYGKKYLGLNINEPDVFAQIPYNAFYEIPEVPEIFEFDDGFVMDELLGNKPVNNNDIVIYEILAEVIKHYGIYLKDGTILKVNDVSELVGKEVMFGDYPVIISGIIRQDFSGYEKFREDVYYSIDEMNVIKNIRKTSFDSLVGWFRSLILVDASFFEYIGGEYEAILASLPIDFEDDYKGVHRYLSRVNPKEKTDINVYDSLMHNEGFGELELNGSIYALSTSVLYYLYLLGQIIFLLSPFILVIMVYAIMMYFENVYKKNREKFAILSCLGLTNKDLTRVYLNSLSVFFMGIITLSVILLASTIIYLNMNLSKLVGFYLHPFSFNATYILISIGILVLTFIFSYIFLRFRVNKRNAIVYLKNN